jgi:hypothetical protein
VLVEQRADVFDVARAHRTSELLDRGAGERIDLAAERGPALESVAARDDELGV